MNSIKQIDGFKKKKKRFSVVVFRLKHFPESCQGDNLGKTSVYIMANEKSLIGANLQKFISARGRSKRNYPTGGVNKNLSDLEHTTTGTANITV